MSKRKIISVILVLVLTLSFVGFVTVPQTSGATFVLASGWNDDNGYGEGISAIYVYENSTGVFLPIFSPAFILPEDDTTSFEINVTDNTALQFAPTYTLNHIVQSIPSAEAGINIMRAEIIVSVLGAVVYDSGNLTLVYGGIQTTTTYWYYAYEIIPILIRAGVTYVIEFTYEIYPYLYE